MKRSSFCRLNAPLLLALLLAPATPLSAQASGDRQADSWFEDGVALFFAGKAKESVAAFDKVVEIAPEAAPRLWQKGLAQYYAEDFTEGRKQFELHQTANANDVENAAWHFICIARQDGAEAARKALIPITGDTRIPMEEIHALYAGTGTREAVLAAAMAGRPGTDTWKNQMCYAHLYLGLHEEALGRTEEAKSHMLKAAVDYRMDHYMGKVAQLHVKLRNWDQK